MNLRDKLKALESTKKKPAAPVQPQFTDCWHTTRIHPLSEFPGCFGLRRETVMLMQGEAMPEHLDPCRILYLDTETTGLAGGAGTVAFQVGLGYLTESGFVIHQYVMRDYPEEKFLLGYVAQMAERFDVICTFNGKTFDLPLLRDRFLLNRMRPDCLDKPQIDLLHIARRVFKLRLRRCNLSHLEEAVLGIPRLDDLPGALVPERFFNYLKTGDFSLLDDVLEHNEQDIASLCVLLGHMCRMYEQPEQLGFDEDVFAMGCALERMRHPEEARRCYRLTSGKLYAQGQLRLAGSLRRCGERNEAVQVWKAMVARHEGGAAPCIELAKHYEHAARDLSSAMAMTQKGLMLLAEPSLLDSPEILRQRADLEKRYERLKRKMKEL